jgi:ubiquinone/menaquinone biosynthesis C-methylase UbiE
VSEGIQWPFTRIYDKYINRIFVKWFRLIAGDIKNRHVSGTIVDIGTGPGRLPLEIAKQVDDVELIGIDISADMVKIARRNAEKEGLSNRVRFRVGSAYDTGLEDGSANMVVSTAMIHHLRDPNIAFSEIFRILKSGGEAWLYDGRRDATKAEIQETVCRLGMEEELPIPLWLVQAMWSHAHVGLKTEAYVSGRVRTALDESPFKDCEVKIEGAYVTMMLRKISG